MHSICHPAGLAQEDRQSLAAWRGPRLYSDEMNLRGERMKRKKQEHSFVLTGARGRGIEGGTGCRPCVR